MALIEILKYPNQRLKIKAKSITKIDQPLLKLVDDMYETMYHVNGVGLAATQIGIDQQIFVMDVSEERNQPYCVLNPEILHTEGLQFENEGCLSVPGGVYDRVERPGKILLRGMNLKGETFELEATGLMAACVQHETDHLNGLLFLDRLSRLKRERLLKKMLKNLR